MCLGGSAAPTYTPPKPRVIEAGPESPNDQVNNVDVSNINDRSQQDAMRKANRGPTASKQKTSRAPTQSQTYTDKSY